MDPIVQILKPSQQFPVPEVLDFLKRGLVKLSQYEASPVKIIETLHPGWFLLDRPISLNRVTTEESDGDADAIKVEKSGLTEAYPPEFLEHGSCDGVRGGIYTLACMAWVLLCGDSPFQAESVLATMTKRLRDQPPSARLIREDCPAFLAEIIQKAMSLNPGDRFSSAEEFLQALQSFRDAG